MSEGDLVAVSGNTGFTENPHLHREVLMLFDAHGTRQTGASMTKRVLNYSTLKIRFDTRDLPFDLYKAELSGMLR